MQRPLRHPLLTALLLVCAQAHGAGGHFDVDDATMLDAGLCQNEAWAARAPSASVTAFHLGPACRLGPVEAGLNLDRYAAPVEAHTLIGPQLKWVTELLTDALAAGLVGSAAFDATSGGRPWLTLYAPFTWRPTQALSVNANVGVDRDPSPQNWRRIGISVEFAANDQLTLIGERVQIFGEWTSRVGARVNLTEAISLDGSVASRGPQALRIYTLGVNHAFAR